jgi:N-acetylglucosamine kinase-like BadF-type ATPase
MKYIIGIDGGGTKTEAILFDMKGNEINRTTSGLGNLVVNEEVALKNIVQAVSNVIEDFPREDCEYIVLGLAGAEVGDNASKVENTIKDKFNCRVKCFNDGVIGLAAIFKDEDGIMTIAGTGSISFGMYKNKQATAGGWGHLLGDEGSGYSIAIKACKIMTREFDNNNEPSCLSKAVMKTINLAKAEEIVKFIYGSDKADIAALAPTVIKEAEAGDVMAVQILEEAGQELAEFTIQVMKKLNFDSNKKIGIVGGILTNCELVRNAFENKLIEVLGEVSILVEDSSPAKGGYYIAKKELERIGQIN